MKRQATEQEIKKILEETERLKTKYFPVYKLLKKKKLKFKHARVGDSPVEYCRIDELEKVVNDHHDQFRELVGNDTPLETLKKLFLYFNRPINAPSLKYPKILEQTSTPSQFASFPFNTQESRKGLMIAIILGILAIVLFPVWPFEMKYAVFIVSFYLLIAIVGLLIVRLLLYSICSLFGFSFWIFPRMLVDNSFITCWKPFYSVQKWETNTFTIVVRLLIFATFIYYGVSFYRDPSLIEENIKITKVAIDDLHEWGLKKIKREENFAQRALTSSLEDIMNKTQEEVKPEEEKQAEVKQDTKKTQQEEIKSEETQQETQQKKQQEAQQETQQETQKEAPQATQQDETQQSQAKSNEDDSNTNVEQSPEGSQEPSEQPSATGNVQTPNTEQPQQAL